jgi:hypothetical protein
MIYLSRFHTPLGGGAYRDQTTDLQYFDSSYSNDEKACYAAAKAAALAVACAQDGVRQEHELKPRSLAERRNLYRPVLEEQPYASASSTLDGAVNSSTTSIVLADASAFPALGSYRILVGRETMQVFSKSSNTLTVRRGAENSTAEAHDSGAACTRVLTKAAIEAM